MQEVALEIQNGQNSYNWPTKTHKAIDNTDKAQEAHQKTQRNLSIHRYATAPIKERPTDNNTPISENTSRQTQHNNQNIIRTREKLQTKSNKTHSA